MRRGPVHKETADSVVANWSRRYTRAAGGNSIVSIYSYAPARRSCRARPLSVLSAVITDSNRRNYVDHFVEARALTLMGGRELFCQH